MADLYTVMHREVGPVAAFVTWDEAVAELERVFGDEPTWLRDLWIEPFDVLVTEDEAEQHEDLAS